MAFNVTGYNAYNPYQASARIPRPTIQPAVSFGHYATPTIGPTIDTFNPTPSTPFSAANPVNYPAATPTFYSTPSPSLGGTGGFNPSYAAPYPLATQPLSQFNSFPQRTYTSYIPRGQNAAPTIIYAMPPELSQQEQRKKYWSKFVMNTGSTLVGLGLAAYFGMKILPKAIVGEMGTQVKNNLLSSHTRKDLLDKKVEELLASPKTPKSVKELLQKDPDTLGRWQQARREKLLLEHCETSEVFSKFLQDSFKQTFTEDYSKELLTRMKAEEQIKESLSNITSDKPFMEGLKNNVQDNFITPLADKYMKDEETLRKEVTDKLAGAFIQSMKDKGGFLSRWALGG